MPVDIRADAAQYYDLNPVPLEDIDFYRGRIPSSNAAVLELGCGTGRVLVPLVYQCAYIHGVDASRAMVAICREKLDEAGIPDSRARVEVGDITDLNLGRHFDLITAPYRVFQNLETDAEIEGFFRTVENHLSPAGACVVNVFKPHSNREVMRREWVKATEDTYWEAQMGEDRVICYGRNVGMDPEKMILYPELIYRRFRDSRLMEEVTLNIVMRCYYPEEFEGLVVDYGFKVIGKWGGYKGEKYGEGPELVIEFGKDR